MKIDLEQRGILAVFKKYQAAMLLKFWQEPGDYSSNEMWTYLNDAGYGTERATTVSRASVINSLNNMVDEGILSFYTITGKGGHRRIYHSKTTPEEFVELVKAKIRLVTLRFNDISWWTHTL